MSIKHNNSEKQLYRINLFNTTSVIDINGKVYQQFITNDLPRITTSVDLREVKELNKKIRKVCELVIDNQTSIINDMRTPLQQVEQGYHLIERQSNSRKLNRHKQHDHKHLELCTLDEGQSMKGDKIQSKQDDSTLEITNSISDESAKQTVDYYCPTCIQEISDSIECSKCNMDIKRVQICLKINLRNTDDRDQICICSSCKLLSEDLETGSLNREGTYTPISFEITND